MSVHLQTASARGIYTVSESGNVPRIMLQSVVHSHSLSVSKVFTAFEVSFSRDGAIIHSFIETANTASLIPEPFTYAALGGLSVLVLAVARRRR